MMAAPREALTLTQVANTLGVCGNTARPAKLIRTLLDGELRLPILVAAPPKQLMHVLMSDSTFVMLCSVPGARGMLHDLVLEASTPPPAAVAVNTTQLSEIIDACSGCAAGVQVVKALVGANKHAYKGVTRRSRMEKFVAHAEGAASAVSPSVSGTSPLSDAERSKRKRQRALTIQGVHIAMAHIYHKDPRFIAAKAAALTWTYDNVCRTSETKSVPSVDEAGRREDRAVQYLMHTREE